jgi:protein-disulfide isomerase
MPSHVASIGTLLVHTLMIFKHTNDYEMATSKNVIQTRDIYIGSANAPITITSYIDYESVPCAKLNAVLNQLLKACEDKVRLNFRHFPMAAKHQKAMKAAEAVVAAAQENLFWQMHNKLLENQKQLGTISLKQYGKQVGVKNKRFLDELVNGVYAWQVREDLLEAVDDGVTTAGTVFINDKKIEGDTSYESLSASIEDILKK